MTHPFPMWAGRGSSADFSLGAHPEALRVYSWFCLQESLLEDSRNPMGWHTSSRPPIPAGVQFLFFLPYLAGCQRPYEIMGMIV